jgi:hypothetical protein
MKAAHRLWVVGVILAASLPHRAEAQTPSSSPVGYVGDGEVTPTPSPWSWLKMPKITMPKIEMPKMPADPFAPVKASARKVGEGTRKAWEGTKELFTFGGSKTAEQPTERVASRPDQPSVWSRMFGGAEKEPEGPQTVADFMRQPRPE